MPDKIPFDPKADYSIYYEQINGVSEVFYIQDGRIYKTNGAFVGYVTKPRKVKETEQ